MTESKKIVVVAIIVLTRETSISLTSSNRHHHHHDHTSKFQHDKTDFSASSLSAHLQNTHTIICHLTSSDIHLTPSLIDAASIAGVKLFIPSEYGLNTSNLKIRELLPPYQTRFAIQNQLRASGLEWTAIYSGLVLEEALKPDGALGIDCLWCSAVSFSNGQAKIALSRWKDIADVIVRVAIHDRVVPNEEFTCSFKATLKEIVSTLEKQLDKPLDVYEGDVGDAKREASERMKRGYFYEGVALMGRVAVWDDSVGAWESWEGREGVRQAEWEEEVGKMAVVVRNGETGRGGCGC